MKDKAKFTELTAGFDLPAQRRDLDKMENLRWLLRNMFMRNQGSPRFEEASALLTKIFCDERKKQHKEF